jgi:hypothetical protein
MQMSVRFAAAILLIGGAAISLPAHAQATISIGSGFGAPFGVAVDASGNVFVADLISRTVKEILAPAYTTTITLGGVFAAPYAIAVDGSGNVFVADNVNNTVVEILAPAYTVVNTLGSGFNGPTGVAVDDSGNVFVTDAGNNAVKEILAPAYTTVNTLASGNDYAGTGGIALDASGNVLVTGFFTDDVGNGLGVVKVLLAPTYTTVTMLGGGLYILTGIAVDRTGDGSGNVFVGDDDRTVREFSASSYYSSFDKLGSGFNGPMGIAVDRNGNVFVADSENFAVKEILAHDEVFKNAFE